MNYVCIIPARLNSTRLPNKIIKEMAGKTLIEHVVDNAKAANIKNIIIACDSLEVMEIAKKICMQRSYLSKLLAKLEEDGYITRKEKIKGKRQIVITIYITKKGEEVQQRMYSLVINTLMSKLNLDMEKMQEISSVLFNICDEGTKNLNLKL